MILEGVEIQFSLDVVISGEGFLAFLTRFELLG